MLFPSNQVGSQFNCAAFLKQLKDADPKAFPALCTKTNKRAFLNAYSKDPFSVDESNLEKINQFLRHGRKSGQSRGETESSREFSTLCSAKGVLTTHIQNPVFEGDPLDLNYSDGNPYFSRAMKYKRNSQHVRALFDLDVASEMFLQKHEHDAVLVCVGESIVSCYHAGLYFLAQQKSNDMLKKPISISPEVRAMGALAAIRFLDGRHPCQLTFNPLQQLCIALAESQEPNVVDPIVATLRENEIILGLVQRYRDEFNNDLMLDLLKLLPRDGFSAVCLSFLSANAMSYKTACDAKKNEKHIDSYLLEFYTDVKLMQGMPFNNNDVMRDPFGALEGVYSRLQYPASSKAAAYPRSAYIAYEAALGYKAVSDIAPALMSVQKSLQINPAFLPARLLSFELNDALATLNDAQSKADPSVYALASDIVACFDKAQALGQDVTPFEVLNNAAKVARVEHAESRRDCIRHFLACDPADAGNYTRACAAIKRKFKKGDRVFADEVTQLLNQGNDEDLMKAIRLCAANGKRTDVANLLLKDERVKNCLCAFAEIDGHNKDYIINLFREKVKKSIQLTLEPPPAPGIFRKGLAIFSSKAQPTVVAMGGIPEPKQ